PSGIGVRFRRSRRRGGYPPYPLVLSFAGASPAVLWLEEALGWQRRAADLVLPDRTGLVGGRIVRGQRPRVAPVAIEVSHLLGDGGAPDVEQEASAADGEFVGNDLGLG